VVVAWEETVQNRYSRILRLLGCVLVAGGLSGLLPAARADTNQGINITTLSSRPDIVSGGTALVRVGAPSGVPLTALTVLLNSENVTSAFQPEASGNSLLGLVQGMPLGRNKLIAEVLGSRNQIVLSARLTLTNYPITGPIFSGPQEQPFYCMTQLFTLPASTQTLGQALDANCSIASRVNYV
jgi:hypothetical protein